ncbi:MAG TPA: hypothetical protein VHA30_01485 [Patescibacteria group bacterium]|nr:hypothetical protein [Patescibacteria group bacterium]
MDNFPGSFYVGGMVRDLLLGRPVTDIDIATAARPEAIAAALAAAGVAADTSYKEFGTIIARQGSLKADITTLRRDLPGAGRYPRIRFSTSSKIDSQRRDFSINALYLSQKNKEITDYHQGLTDLKDKKIRFIGAPARRIAEDPLRIVRALRFALELNFNPETRTLAAIKKYFPLVKTLTRTRLQKEIDRAKTAAAKNNLAKLIAQPNLLDNYFK